jgi:hypothetical protein
MRQAPKEQATFQFGHGDAAESLASQCLHRPRHDSERFAQSRERWWMVPLSGPAVRLLVELDGA